MALVREEFFFPSHNGAEQVYVQLWREDSLPPVGLLQIIHGMCEYGDRYAELAQALVAHGFVVAVADTAGHGRTAGPGRLGFLAEKRGDQVVVADAIQCGQLLRQRFPTLPFFLMGHSFGSMIARGYMARCPEGLQGVVLCGTAGRSPLAFFSRGLLRLVIALRGPRTRSQLLSRLAFWDYNRHFGRRTDYEWLSKDTQRVDAYAADPLCNYTFTAAGFLDIANLLCAISARRWYRELPKALPCILLAGGMDPVGNYGKGVREVYRRMQAAGMQDVTLRLFADDRHELLNETDREQVIQEILQWLLRHLPGQGS